MICRSTVILSLCLVLPQLGAAQTPQGKVVLDIWDVAYLQGGRAGYFHTLVREVERDGQKFFHTIAELNLTVKRFREIIQLRMDTGTTETPDGKVVATYMRQHLGKNKQLTIHGIVDGKVLKLTQDNKHLLQNAPWDGQVVGMYRQEILLRDRQVKPGDVFSYRSFEPYINLVMTMQVRVKDHEEVELLGGKTKKRLLRVEVQSEKIDKLQLPLLLLWVNDRYERERAETEIPGLGKIVQYRTNRATAQGPVTLVQNGDIGTGQYIRLKQRITRPHDTTEAVYRLTIKDDEDPASTFAQDERQQVKKAQGQTIDLLVRASRPPQADLGQDKPAAEFSQSSYFINSDDARVRQLARLAVGGERDPWNKAARIERWVHEHMSSRGHEALATADHVARTLEGDCTEYAMLTAAMCRAEGVPARTAVGLIYADVLEGPVFAFHMWTEVWVRGRWIPIDATLGRGHVGATHLKITDHSWHEMRAATPLLPVIRVLGKLKVDVVRVK